MLKVCVHLLGCVHLLPRAASARGAALSLGVCALVLANSPYGHVPPACCMKTMARHYLFCPRTKQFAQQAHDARLLPCSGRPIKHEVRHIARRCLANDQAMIKHASVRWTIPVERMNTTSKQTGTVCVCVCVCVCVFGGEGGSTHLSTKRAFVAGAFAERHCAAVGKDKTHQ